MIETAKVYRTTKLTACESLEKAKREEAVEIFQDNINADGIEISTPDLLMMCRNAVDVLFAQSATFTALLHVRKPRAPRVATTGTATAAKKKKKKPTTDISELA